MVIKHTSLNIKRLQSQTRKKHTHTHTYQIHLIHERKKNINIYHNSLISIAYITIHKKRIAIKNKIQNYGNLTGFSFMHTRKLGIAESLHCERNGRLVLASQSLWGMYIFTNKESFVTNAPFLSYGRISIQFPRTHLQKSTHETTLFVIILPTFETEICSCF